MLKFYPNGSKVLTMLISHFLSIISSCAVLGWAGTISVLLLVDPQVSNLGKTMLFISVFVAIVSTLTVIGYLGRWLFNRHLSLTAKIGISFRQGLLFGLAAVIGLFLQSQRLLTAGNALLLVALLAAVEYFFLSLKQNQMPTSEIN